MTPAQPITIIKASTSFWQLNLSEIWQFRELFQTLVWRDIKVKYKQTIIGIIWAIVQPFTQMVVFSFFFGKLANMPSDNVPYPLFSFSGLILWTMFTSSLSNSSNSMLNSSHLISKVYFPRLIVPIASTLITYIDYLIAWIVIWCIFIVYKFIPPWTIILSPVLAIGPLMLANGLGFFLSAINVQFRDVRYVLPFFLQLLIFVSPVIYPASVAGQFQWIVALNPMTGYLELHRSLILGHQSITFFPVIYSLTTTLMIFFLGVTYFNRQQRKFSDII